ncbi:DNA-binding protein [Trinickia violacea]|uniref:DNA-binding protein n=1 Tax=Trinickia violacea TaxID=2571746 RepID=A0A4P8ISE7_9BURK|nr:DNA-binding protein [Trinickia violacea]QCP50173.1 DNA-binding protein [Trinickia violacea]
MTETTEKLFHTTEAALKFAFSYSMQQQDRPLVNRMASPALRTGKGLAGNDGAGQAGMLRRELQQLSELDRAVLIARFAPRSIPCQCRHSCCSGYKINPEWDDALRVLEQAALTQLAGHLSNYVLRRRLVEKSIGVKVELKALACACGVSENTASAHWKIIKEWMYGKPKPKKLKDGKRVRVPAGDGTADVVPHNAADGGEPTTSSDGLESSARKRADELLSSLSFIGQ